MSKRKKKHSKIMPEWLPPALVAVVAVAALVLLICFGKNTEPSQPETSGTNPTLRVEDAQQVKINLGYGMYLVDVAKYTGIYMEDGTNEVVSGVLMIVVENTGDTDIQYAEIELPVGKELASFSLTNLPAGERIVLLEKNRMEWQKDVTYTTAISKNVVVFQSAMDICDDRLQIQGGDGTLTVTNISNEDISGNIVIYYKNCSSDTFYGGITYRVVLSGGLPQGESVRIVAGHFSISGSRVVYVTCGVET